MDQRAIISGPDFNFAVRAEKTLASSLPPFRFGYYSALYFAYFAAPAAALHAEPEPVT